MNILQFYKHIIRRETLYGVFSSWFSALFAVVIMFITYKEFGWNLQYALLTGLLIGSGIGIAFHVFMTYMTLKDLPHE